MKNKITKILCLALIAIVVPCCVLLSGCTQDTAKATEVVVTVKSIDFDRTEGLQDIYVITYTDGTTKEFSVKNGSSSTSGADNTDSTDTTEAVVAVKSIDYNRTEDLKDIYVITYTDGTQKEFTVTNGADGKDGVDGKNGVDGADGANGEDGQDAEKVSIRDIYTDYLVDHPGVSYEEFLKTYLSYEDDTKVQVINQGLSSSVILYSEFKITETSFGKSTKSISRSGGSGVIFQIDDDYTYIITNYHVVYNSTTNSDNGGNIAYRIAGYLYGSISSNGYKVDDNGNYVTTTDGYKVFDYGQYGIDFTYIGGSAEKDLAVIRANTSDIFAINPNIKAVEFADGYRTGETAIAIGNVEGKGISVTEGIVSVDSEYVLLDIDATRYYRSMRIDTSIYEGSSGGGLFNSYGKLIGITNAGDNTDQNINYAIPISIVKGVVDGIMYYAQDSDDTTTDTYKLYLGITIKITDAKYVYDSSAELSNIVETIEIEKVDTDSFAEKLGVQVGDTLQSIIINGTEYKITRDFEMGDLLLTIRVGDNIKLKVSRTTDGVANSVYTNECEVEVDNLVQLT